MLYLFKRIHTEFQVKNSHFNKINMAGLYVGVIILSNFSFVIKKTTFISILIEISYVGKTEAESGAGTVQFGTLRNRHWTTRDCNVLCFRSNALKHIQWNQVPVSTSQITDSVFKCFDRISRPSSVD